jgi:hypothetical protein
MIAFERLQPLELPGGFADEPQTVHDLQPLNDSVG